VLVGHPDIHFNLSHCREAVACVVSRRPVGIDVESVSHYKESVARYTMNDEELAMIEAAERPEAAFIRLWTMKEARLKLTGEGITDDLKTALADSACYRFTTTERLTHNYIYTVCEEKESYDL
jgi:4'-phosphopantetheinyl transferase